MGSLCPKPSTCPATGVPSRSTTCPFRRRSPWVTNHNSRPTCPCPLLILQTAMFLYTSRWKMGPLHPTQAIPSWVSRSLRPTPTIQTWVSGPRCSLRHSNIPSPAGTAGPHQAVPRTTWRAWGHRPCHILPRSQARRKGAAAEESRNPTMPSQHIFSNTPSPPSHTASHRE